MELDAYHEAGHAYMAIRLGGRVTLVSIEPESDDGPRRSGETQVRWSRKLTERQLCERAIQVALAGPVAEMLYSGSPYHPGLVAEWAQDWQMARQQAQRIEFLERMTVALYRQLDVEPHWSAIAALADHLLAHETLEGTQVREIVGDWM
jgi:ATP-dependent Zn protease